MTAFQVLFIAGITNIIFLTLILLSCRCIGLRKCCSKWLDNEKFQRFYKLHCFYWYGFIISVLIHTILAFYLFGWPGG